MGVGLERSVESLGKDIQDTINKIEEMGYTYKINFPYSGSLVPNVILNNHKHDGKVVSIMLEINKRIYL